MSEGIKIGRSTAEKEFQKFVEYYEIDEFENKDQQELFDSAKSKIVKAIIRGRLEISEVEGEFLIIQTTRKGQRITYREIDGQAKMESDKAGDGQNHGRIYSLLGYLSGDGQDAIKQLKGPDLSLAENLGAAFLAV
jgi:hypothetical protein